MAELQTSVRRLVTRCSQEHALARRWQLSHALDALDWSPPGLPRTAILCLRHLANPSPGPLLTGSAPWQPTDAWRAGFSKSLEQNARHAARPAQEVVGADANAVLFADHAELLACLALDWCARSTFLRWWWKVLFPALDVAEAVRKAWTENPQHVPAALCRLDQAGHSTEFLRALPVSTAAKILENVLSSFGLVELRPALIAALDLLPVSSGRYMATVTKPAAPWIRWVNIDPALSPEHQHLLIVCAMLERAPGVIRSPGFARALCEWNEAAGNISETHLRKSEFHALAETVAPRPSRASDPGDASPGGIQSKSKRPTGRISGPVLLPPNPREPALGDTTLLAGAAASASSTKLTPVLSSTQSRNSLAEPPSEISFTDWGGVFYLVNVALALGLYADFTMPLKAGLPLPVWDFLALIGRRLIGAELESDPLWTVMAKLSGRDQREPPGQWFEPPKEWRIPADWLAPFPELGAWRWSVALGRLRLIHPQNFFVVDASLVSEEPIQQIVDEMRRLGVFADKAPRLQSDFWPSLSVERLERWLDWLVPYIEARLERALGVEEAETFRDLVFRQQARLEITAARVDVRFELAKHPIELRLAGLDRDPGWVPAAGRTLVFHYD